MYLQRPSSAPSVLQSHSECGVLHHDTTVSYTYIIYMYINIGTLTAIFKLLFPIIYSFESTILMMVYARVSKLYEHFDIKSEFKYPS